MKSTSRKRLAVCRRARGLPPAPGSSPVPAWFGAWEQSLLLSPCVGETLFAPVHDAEPAAAPACARGADTAEVSPL